ncbi:unnamed protein product [Didymodactylos carnosus]|uniref:EGF-like domain-containing protein n=1 Tax=Didymodactylos carnosus TaxID=1234261 RepID=A0A813YT55_9BILA|nr:unnamed protein product [Didymodactylos carnosus]CAF0888699.1 unnamed protein product [Didymodactylos carnosus]CAF3536923.1 unnamed protein product [Didymodactylos carnosus]CAF3673452.1 unnamed protein product [Didymodactylos carnosus]
MPYICACQDGSYSNSSCIQLANSTGIQSRRLIAVCEHTFCGQVGICIILDATFACVCPDGTIGENCLTSVIRICNVISPGYATCWCLLGFDGDFCERRSGASTCSTLQCLNSGTCYEHSPASTIFAYCLCRPGFTGQRCEAGHF